MELLGNFPTPGIDFMIRWHQQFMGKVRPKPQAADDAGPHLTPSATLTPRPSPQNSVSLALIHFSQQASRSSWYLRHLTLAVPFSQEYLLPDSQLNPRLLSETGAPNKYGIHNVEELVETCLPREMMGYRHPRSRY